MLPDFSNGDGENRTRFVVDTKPESDRLDEVPPTKTSSDNESGGVGFVGVPPEDPRVVAPPGCELYAMFFSDDLIGVRGVRGSSSVCGRSISAGIPV
jgi:hypothetical protein